MKKTFLAIIAVFTVLFCGCALCACDGGADTGTNQNGGAVNPDGGGDGGGTVDPDQGDGGGTVDPDGGGGSGQEPVLSEFDGVTFADAAYDFDGQPHSLSVSGSLPAETKIVYDGNGKTNAGVYPVSATLSKDGYRTKTLTANLTIRKIAIVGIEFRSQRIEYDACAHSVEITGVLPAGCSAVYSGGSGIARNEATEVGTYTITVTVTGENYLPLTLTATLTIISKEELLFTYRLGNTVYFQNPLDGDKLYNAQNDVVAKSSNDKPQYFTSVGDDVFFLSKTLFASGIAVFRSGKSDILYEVSDAKYLVTDGTHLYYSVDSVSSAFKKTTGIYRISIADLKNEASEPSATRLTDCKASCLQVYGGYVYFSNETDGKKLYRISADANNGVSELVYDHKVTDIVLSDSKLYFTRGMTADKVLEGSAIYSYDLETRAETRIACSKGKYLLPLLNEIYFVNTDMLTSTIFGDGIYKAPKDGSGWISETFELLVGASKVVEAGANDAIYSLTTDGASLYYYRTRDKHLYRYDPESETEVDLMRSFTPKEDSAIPLTPYGELKEYGGYLWYNNLSDGGKLYRCDPTTGEKVRATSSMVADFAFDGDFLYYAGFRLTNCDIYRTNLVTGLTERISTDKGMHFAFTDDKIYYMNCKGKNTLDAMNKDGSENRTVFDTVDDYDVTAYDGKIYFVATYLYCYDPNVGTAKKVSESVKPNEYLISDGTVYFLNNQLTTNAVTALPLSGGGATQIQSLGTTGSARSFFEYRGDVYYFARTGIKNIKTALYRVGGGAAEEVPVPGLEGRYMNSALVSGDKVYFLDVWFMKDTVPLGSGKLMALNMQTKTVQAV